MTTGKGSSEAPPVPIEECLSAVLHGVVGTTPATYDGVTKDEALEYAGVLAERVQAVLTYIGEMGCVCPSDHFHASLQDHEIGCFAQIEHLLRTFQSDRGSDS